MPSKDYVTKDSGARRQFETGAVRDVAAGKGRFDLISPWAMERLAGVLERGSVKYGDRNWEKGIALSSFVDSALRHLNQFCQGMADEDHLGQALWNIHALIHTEEMIRRVVLPKELDDLPRHEPALECCPANDPIDLIERLSRMVPGTIIDTIPFILKGEKASHCFTGYLANCGIGRLSFLISRELNSPETMKWIVSVKVGGHASYQGIMYEIIECGDENSDGTFLLMLQEESNPIKSDMPETPIPYAEVPENPDTKTARLLYKFRNGIGHCCVETCEDLADCTVLDGKDRMGICQKHLVIHLQTGCPPTNPPETTIPITPGLNDNRVCYKGDCPYAPRFTARLINGGALVYVCNLHTIDSAISGVVPIDA